MRDKNRFWCTIRCDIQKSVKLDANTVTVIETYRGVNFSDKLRNYVFDMEKLRSDLNLKE